MTTNEFYLDSDLNTVTETTTTCKEDHLVYGRPMLPILPMKATIRKSLDGFWVAEADIYPGPLFSRWRAIFHTWDEALEWVIHPGPIIDTYTPSVPGATPELRRRHMGLNW